jgi:hypothetical protein
MPEIEADDARVPVAHHWLDSAYDTRSSTVGNDSHVRLRAPLKNVVNVPLGLGISDEVWRIREVSEERANDVTVRSAISVEHSLVVVVCARAREAGGRSYAGPA